MQLLGECQSNTIYPNLELKNILTRRRVRIRLPENKQDRKEYWVRIHRSIDLDRVTRKNTEMYHERVADGSKVLESQAL
jgi:hypothetical protein